MAKFLTFSGSARVDSFNQKTVLCIGNELQKQGASVTNIRLSEFQAPVYHGDEEATKGLPEATARFKSLLHESDALVISCPEYNGFMTPLLLNTIDWATRSSDASVDLSGFKGKPVLVTSSSPGPGGGSRAAVHLKTLLAGIGCFVSPDNFMVPSGFNAFDESGQLVDEGLQKRANQIAQQFSDFSNKLIRDS
jgi:NAD(P)H-dependent FMN reductase